MRRMPFRRSWTPRRSRRWSARCRTTGRRPTTSPRRGSHRSDWVNGSTRDGPGWCPGPFACRSWQGGDVTFDGMWAELDGIGRHPSTGGYRRYAWTDTDLELREWFVAAAAARRLDVVLDR